ncbi:Hexose carrier protein HEX6 [Sesamum alatum]|uniref:Hexose carrier protein HEX6 n=1 Tax=Sesamum alatum TaxID=300844 RepID=A0AAE2CWQ5_9LAMI|nr:Hexose carrier protein HEX6 [Sesamum alatum]
MPKILKLFACLFAGEVPPPGQCLKLGGRSPSSSRQRLGLGDAPLPARGNASSWGEALPPARGDTSGWGGAPLPARAYLVNYITENIKGDWGWRISLATAALPALILILPETPNSLIQQGHDHTEVKRLLQRIHGHDDVHAELDDLIASSNASKAIKYPFTNIMQRRYRPQLVMSIAIPLFQQVTGINVITFYAPILFQTLGSGVSASLLSSIVLGIVGLSMTIFSSSIVDKLGRRVIFQVSEVQMLSTQLMIGAIMAAKLGDHGDLSQGYSITVLILIGVYMARFEFSWGPLGWLVPSEIFPLEIRSAAQSITVAVSFFFSFLVTQTFLAMLCHLKYWTFFFFGFLGGDHDRFRLRFVTGDEEYADGKDGFCLD